MIIDYIIGNPPYQANKENTHYASSLYNLFMLSSFNISDNVCLITPAKFLFNIGNTPNDFTNDILNDTHFKVIKYFDNSNEVFSMESIKGGVVITYRNLNENFGSIYIFFRQPELQSIKNKIITNNFTSMQNIIYASESYGLTDKLHEENPWAIARLSNGHKYTVQTNIFETLHELFLANKPNIDYIGIYGLINKQRSIRYIRKEYIKYPDNFEYYKVLLPRMNGSGKSGKDNLSTPFVAEPYIGATATFLSIGKFSTREEAENCIKYINTKFARALLSICKVTQSTTTKTWKYIPMQDFSNNSDIDWSSSDIDKQLYDKYKLTVEERTFIDSNIP